MKIIKYILFLCALWLIVACDTSDELAQDVLLQSEYSLRLQVEPVISSLTRAATSATESEKKIESLELFYFALSDKEYFYKQEIKIDSEGLFGIGNLDQPDIPIPEGVFTYAQRSGKYAQFIVVAVANYSIGLTSTGTVEENSYYKAWANTEGNNGETLKLIDENLRINLLTNTDDQYFPKTNGDVLPMVARGTFSLLKGENVLLEGNEYNRRSEERRVGKEC